MLIKGSPAKQKSKGTIVRYNFHHNYDNLRINQISTGKRLISNYNEFNDPEEYKNVNNNFLKKNNSKGQLSATGTSFFKPASTHFISPYNIDDD